jgi:hypothetical protein
MKYVGSEGRCPLFYVTLDLEKTKSRRTVSDFSSPKYLTIINKRNLWVISVITSKYNLSFSPVLELRNFYFLNIYFYIINYLKKKINF